MNSWANRVEKGIKVHDSKLFIQETRLGRYDIYRKSEFGCHLPNFVFALTEDWSANGRPVEHGIDVVINRVKAHDLWHNTDFMEDYIKTCEKISEDKEKKRKNSIEGFLYDFRRQFQRATESVNTGTLNKIYREEK